MEIVISKRLKAIASLVPDGSIVCDVGCDHALLCIHLVSNKIAKKAIAMDIAEGPLSKARENISSFNFCELIETRLSDGLEKLNRNEISCLIIAGMGGNLIIDILKAKKDIWKDIDTIILSPQRDEMMVREYMSKNAYYEMELFIRDREKYYNIMKFVPKKSANFDTISKGELLLGKEASAEYLTYHLNRFKKIESALKDSPDSKNNSLKKKEIQDNIAIINEYLKERVQ